MLYQQNERTPLMIAERLSAQANHAYDEELGGEFRYPNDRSIADW